MSRWIIWLIQRFLNQWIKFGNKDPFSAYKINVSLSPLMMPNSYAHECASILGFDFCDIAYFVQKIFCFRCWHTKDPPTTLSNGNAINSLLRITTSHIKLKRYQQEINVQQIDEQTNWHCQARIVFHRSSFWKPFDMWFS